MKAFREAELERYFQPGAACEVVGFTLVHDPDLGRTTFSSYAAKRRPRIFVTECGPLVDRFDVGDIQPGDALWLVGGNPARFRSSYIESVPVFVEALATMYDLRLPTRVVWARGSARNDCRIGSTYTAQCRIPVEYVDELIALRDSLRAHARKTGRPWITPRMHFNGALYFPYAVAQSLRAYRRRFRIESGVLCNAVKDYPVHKQYFHVFLQHLRAPCRAVVEKQGSFLHLQRFSNGDRRSVEDSHQSLQEEMAGYQIGSTSWFWGYLKSWVRAGHMRRSDEEIVFRKVSVNAIEITVQEPGSGAQGTGHCPGCLDSSESRASCCVGP